LLAVLAASACVAVDPTPDYDRAKERVEAATGEEVLYAPGDEEATRSRVQALLLGGLTAQEAVQVALLNNRDLQEALFEIGIARADVVQAGLLSNPSLDVVVRLPLDGGSTNTEGGLLFNLIELWQLPARKRLATSQLERSVYEVAHMAAGLAARAKSAYFAAVAAREAEAVAEENLATARTFVDLTLERQSAGAATQVDVNAARSQLLEQEVTARLARFSALEARRQLALVLGLEESPTEVQIAERLADPPAWSLDLEDLLARARQHRLDLHAAARQVEAAESELELERRSLLRSAGAGVGFEAEGSARAIGPGVELQIPIFDQNQAQIAKAAFRLGQARRRLEGLTTAAMQEVRGAHARYSLSQDTVRLFQEELLPLRESSLDLAREAFAAGKTGFLSVLEAQEQLLTARRDFVGHLETLVRAIPDLEAACGQPLQLLLPPDAPDQHP